MSVVRSVTFSNASTQKNTRFERSALLPFTTQTQTRGGKKRERERVRFERQEQLVLFAREAREQHVIENINPRNKSLSLSSSNVSKNDAFCVCAETSGFLLLAVHSVLLFVLFIVYDVALFFGRVCDHNHPDKEDLLDG